MLFSLVSPQPEDYEEVPADPKAKKDPKNQGAKKFTEEEEEQHGSKKIYIESKSDIEPKELKIQLKMVF